MYYPFLLDFKGVIMIGRMKYTKNIQTEYSKVYQMYLGYIFNHLH